MNMDQLDIKVLRMQPRDVLVVKCNHILSTLAAEGLKRQVESVIPAGTKVLIADDRINLEILRCQ